MSREMVDSGIPWIGDVPKEWKKIRIKHIFEIIGGNGFKDKYQGKESGDYPFYKTSDINGDCDYVSTSSNYVDADVVDIENYNIVPVSSIVVSKIGAAMRKNHRKITTCDCCIDNNLQALHPIRTIDDVKYLYYLLKVVNFEWFDNNGTIPSVNNAKLKDLYVPWVSLSEQQRIAEFLDRKCAEVDDMIALQEQIIEELKAYKQSVITEAVTKGLNPAAPMRDSGIDWIGSIPEHWETAYLKRFCKVNSGREIEIELEQDIDNAVPVYGSGGVFKYTNKPQFNGEVVMFGRKGTLGKPIYANGRFWAVDTMYYLTFGNSLEARYCFYQLVAFNWEPYITQTALPSIVATDIVNTSFAFPSIAEQQAIADYLDEKCADIDSLIQTKQSKIDSLKEYKKSIIYEYVTGKREVE